MASSLAAATSTRADSASRHMQACRVNFDAIKAYAKDENDMINSKFKYCMHKDELAVSVSKALMPDKHVSTSSKYPYPSVVTTLGCIDDTAKAFMCYANHWSSASNYEKLLTDAYTAQENLKISVTHVAELKEYTPVGYSVGLAYAHPSSGDNIAAVMVGGVVTVMNGAFEMRTGDMVQFYWDFEENMFKNTTAERNAISYSFDDVKTLIGIANSADVSAKRRKTWYGKQANGMNKETQKQNVAMIKPYVRHKGRQVFADNERVFAKAISSARPYEMVDILISRQAL
ncbi:hypothetical protein T484DRAFT_1757934 [Baffinella frigidus]|nr:hypothetical protein T484DRAFT_1757934 [Cryptophyta sp. CCMP2293]